MIKNQHIARLVSLIIITSLVLPTFQAFAQVENTTESTTPQAETAPPADSTNSESTNTPNEETSVEISSEVVPEVIVPIVIENASTTEESTSSTETTETDQGVSDQESSATLRIANTSSISETSLAPTSITTSLQTLPSFSVTRGNYPIIVKANEEVSLLVNVTNNGPDYKGAIVDTEVYNSSGQRVFQDYMDVSMLNWLSGNTIPFSHYWIPKDPGTYTVYVGVFGNNWATLHTWVNTGTINVGAGTTPPPTQNDFNVIFSNTRQDASAIKQSGTNTFYAQVQSPNTNNTVLIDLELYNSSGQRVAQKFVDNVFVPKNGTASFQDTFQLTSPDNLPAGTYYWSAGIFKPGWSQTIKWYPAVHSFTVSGTQPPTGTVGLHTTVLNPATFGSCPTLTAILENTTANPKTVLVDIELRNSAGELVTQHFVDNYVINPNSSTQDISNICSFVLQPGNYSYSVGIFNPGWQGIISWNQSVKTFTK